MKRCLYACLILLKVRILFQYKSEYKTQEYKAPAFSLDIDVRQSDCLKSIFSILYITALKITRSEQPISLPFLYR